MKPSYDCILPGEGGSDYQYIGKPGNWLSHQRANKTNKINMSYKNTNSINNYNTYYRGNRIVIIAYN